ncbi:helix-turn-helix domain-containing protein [Providencia rettgeri]|uniref:helix-turn-helix domain-containing protein n=1 Tax=Providencia rettgeri TaxID=587 RepID=UPI00301A69AE
MSYKKNDIEPENKPSRIISQEQINRFGERLREAMNGMSNNAFAKQCGWSEKVIRNYLNGESYPSLDRLAVIANVSGRPVGWLVTGETDEASDILTNDMGKLSSSSATPEQQRVWKEILDRMTPIEREAVLDSVFRQGINALLRNAQAVASHHETIDDLSADDMLIARMYASLAPEDKKSFLESFFEDERSKANRDMSDKTKAS